MGYTGDDLNRLDPYRVEWWGIRPAIVIVAVILLGVVVGLVIATIR